MNPILINCCPWNISVILTVQKILRDNMWPIFFWDSKHNPPISISVPFEFRLRKRIWIWGQWADTGNASNKYADGYTVTREATRLSIDQETSKRQVVSIYNIMGESHLLIIILNDDKINWILLLFTFDFLNRCRCLIHIWY